MERGTVAHFARMWREALPGDRRVWLIIAAMLFVAIILLAWCFPG